MPAAQYILVDQETLEKVLREIEELKHLVQRAQDGKTNSDEDILMDTADLMKYLKLDRKTIYNYRTKRGMPFERKDGGRIYYWKSAIDRYFGKISI